MTTTAHTLQAAPGKPIDGQNLVTRDNTPHGLSRAIDAIRIACANGSASNSVADTQGYESSVVNASGSTKAHISGVTQNGVGRALTFSSATRMIADLIQHRSATKGDYCVYAGLDGKHLDGPVNCKVLRADLLADNGREHALRIHKFRNLQIGDDKLRLAGLPFACRFVYRSGYNGAAITLKEGNGFTLFYVQTFGPVGFGPNDAEIPPAFNPGNPHPGDPNWASLRTINGVIVHCEFNVGKRFLHFQSGTENVTVRDSVVRADADCGCLQIDGPRGPHGEWPIATVISFVNTQFFGASLLGRNIDSAAVKKLLAGFSFAGCTLNGKAI